MERRVLLAISLSFLVLFGYQTFFPPPPEPTSSSTSSSQSGSQASPPAASGTPAATPGLTAAPAATAAAVTSDTVEREFVVETTTVRATFTNRGARLVHWQLKAYPDAGGALVDLVPADVPSQPLPFSLGLESPGASDAVNTALFVVEHDPPATVNATASAAALTFVYEGADGLSVRKRFTLQPAGYEFSALVDVKRNGAVVNPKLLWGPGLGDEIARSAGSGGLFSGNYTYPAAAFVDREGKFERWAGAKASSAGVQQGAFRYAGVTDQHSRRTQSCDARVSAVRTDLSFRGVCG